MAIVVSAAALTIGVPAAGAATVPPNFESRPLAFVPQATGLAFTPDGRLLITAKNGKVWIYASGVLHSTPAIDLGPQVCTEIERGLQGVAVGPDFTDSRYIFLYYTYDRGMDNCGTDWRNPETTAVNRVSRFTLGEDDRVDAGSERVLIDNIPSPSGFHNGGDLHFGKDGYLYVTVGDGSCDYTLASGCGPYNGAARHPHALTGKILRITSDGDVPTDNPHTGPGTTRCNVTGRATAGTWCQETYASGLRNPFRFAFDQSATVTRFFINDVGQVTWEEIDEGQVGADYGWNLREGPCAIGSTTDCDAPAPGLTNPIFAYSHSSGCTSVTAGAFVPRGVWPAEYDGAYLFGDFVCEKIFRLAHDGSGGYDATEVASEAGPLVAMTFGPPGSSEHLYYLTWTSPTNLHRLSFTGGANRTPTAVANASPTAGTLPLDVSFDGRESSDPDGDPLSYEWNFGDGSPGATGPTTTHRYTTTGTRNATLRVTDPSGADDVQAIRIDAGNQPPVPSIASPTAGKRFAVGESLTLSGSGTDPEDGPLADSTLSWEVVKHHASHIHPFLSPTTGNDLPVTAPFPEDFSSTTNSYLEVRLTTTDSRGLSNTVTRELRPALVDLTFATDPTDLRLELNGTTAPGSLTSWEGWSLGLNAPDPQSDAAGQGQTFVSWSDGGAQQHTITTPASDRTYTATFTSRYVRPRSASPARVALVPAYRACTSPNATHGPPLEDPSCSPPVQASSHTTVGTPDANGVPARSTGRAALNTLVGDPSTAANEADVRVNVSITAVLDRARGGDYYVGDLQARIPIGITDRHNGPGLADSATVTEFPLSVDMPCTPDLELGGSTCRAVTTVNALIPGSVIERKRAVWALGQVQVFDGGEDGDLSTPDNELLATQGLFVP